MQRRPFNMSIWITLLGVSVLLAISPAFAQTRSAAAGEAVVAKVDTRIELTSIVARLAGYGEYNNNQFKRYADDVDRYFARYKNHPVVEFAKQVREKNRIGFDAVPNLAVHLSPPPSLTPRVALSAPSLDERWGRADAEKFAVLLKQFYDDADCAAFFNAHAGMYRTAEQRFQVSLNRVRFAWYKHFYGEQPAGTFNLVLGLLNGPGNFGPRVVHPDGREDLYAIMGTWRVDNLGLPVYNDDQIVSNDPFPTIIHEYNHSFVNRLIDKNAALFERSGTVLAQEFADPMRQQGYAGWRTLVLESLVRACVVHYLQKHPSGHMTAQLQLAEEESRGFLWMGKLVAFLGEYENNRKRYPTLESFVGRIAGFFDTLPAQTVDIKKSFARKQPKIVRVAPFPNNAAQVDENTREVRITFDRKMLGRTEFYPIDAKDPFVSPPAFASDGKTLVGKIKLAPNDEYGLGLRGAYFRSADGYALAEDFPLYFTTRGYIAPPQAPRFGYRIDGDKVTLSFVKPRYLETKIESVAVAGQFNGWNPQAEGYQFMKVGDDTYQLTVPADRIGKPGEKKQFTFVVNGSVWLEPARQALNVVKDARGFRRLVIDLSQEPSSGNPSKLTP